MSWTKPHIITDTTLGTGFEVNYGPHGDAYRVTISYELGNAWIVDFDELGLIDKVEPSGFDEPPTWEDASRAIRFALTTYLMQKNT